MPLLAMAHVYILSGIPGSGKSHWVSKHPGLMPGDWNRVSADKYFELRKIPFDPHLLSPAHQVCYFNYIALLEDGRRCGLGDDGPIFVDNTNLSAWEISPYYLAAEAFGHKVEIVRVNCVISKAFQRQKHGVPASNFDKMVARFSLRDYLPWWKVIEVDGNGG